MRLPAFLQSGTAQAMVTGAVLVLSHLGWLFLPNEAAVAIESAFRALPAARP